MCALIEENILILSMYAVSRHITNKTYTLPGNYSHDYSYPRVAKTEIEKTREQDFEKTRRYMK